VKFVFESNFYNFEYWKSELGLYWLLQYFHLCNWYNSLLCHIHYQFSFFFHHIPHSSFFFWKHYTCPVDMKVCKHVLKLLRYYKINFYHYTYMRKNRDISPQITISLVFGGPKKQAQLTLNVSFLEYRRNWRLKFGEIVVMQGDYKISYG
jgi:hypothetical protein